MSILGKLKLRSATRFCVLLFKTRPQRGTNHLNGQWIRGKGRIRQNLATWLHKAVQRQKMLPDVPVRVDSAEVRGDRLLSQPEQDNKSSFTGSSASENPNKEMRLCSETGSFCH